MTAEAFEQMKAWVVGLGDVLTAMQEQHTPLPRLLTFEQTAEALAVGRTTVQGLVDGGKLPVVMVTPSAPRVDARDVEAYIKARRERRG